MDDDDTIKYLVGRGLYRGWYFLDEHNGAWIGPYVSREEAEKARKELNDYRSNKRH